MTKEQYLRDPCGMSSIPLWKANELSIPDFMRIVHDRDFDTGCLEHYSDELYFRLKHDLSNTTPPILPENFLFCAVSVEMFAGHINSCYTDLHISYEELQSYTLRETYSADLWIAVKEKNSGKIVATGIAELDRKIREGILEWIQVSPAYRGLGLARCIVQELLYRMESKADFCTVSGQCNNPTKPELLYRRCGFTGSDIWHILKQK